MKKFVSLFIVLAVLGSSAAHTYHTGSCPGVSPVTDFQMNRVRRVSVLWKSD